VSALNNRIFIVNQHTTFSRLKVPTIYPARWDGLGQGRLEGITEAKTTLQTFEPYELYKL